MYLRYTKDLVQDLAFYACRAWHWARTKYRNANAARKAARGL